MKIMNNRNYDMRITNMSFEDGYLHLITEIDVEIPSTFIHSKHTERHFIFYNCKVVEKKVNSGMSHKTRNLYTQFKYKISYDKKFTSKFKSDIDQDFIKFLREEKINILL